MAGYVYIYATVEEDENGYGSSYGNDVPFYVGYGAISSNDWSVSFYAYSGTLDLDAGFYGIVLLEARWYDSGYDEWVSQWVRVLVDTN
jgi:hypothetical protein